MVAVRVMIALLVFNNHMLWFIRKIKKVISVYKLHCCPKPKRNETIDQTDNELPNKNDY